MKQKLRQIVYDLRHQRVISLITLAGTALAVFLLMTVVMMQEVMTAPFSPLSKRENLVYSSGLHIAMADGRDKSSYLASEIAGEIYDGLEGIELTAYYQAFPDNITVKIPGGKAASSVLRRVDDKFWSIYDFNLIEGRYFTKSEFDAGANVVVVTAGLAEKLYGKESAIGKEILFRSEPHRVIGIIEDVPGLAVQAFANIYAPLNNSGDDEFGLCGEYRAVMLLKDGYPLSKVRNQVKARYAEIETKFASDSIHLIYHQSPYDRYDMNSEYGTNTDPEPDEGRTMRMIIYAILLIVPAVNLSSMTHSRMRNRISEIGVRRAFGCTRSRIILDIITENFIITLFGAVIGLIACIIFTTSYSSLLFSWDTMGLDTSLPLEVLINVKVFGIALGVCLLLNILSASLPAWLASRINPVDAINAKRN